MNCFFPYLTGLVGIRGFILHLRGYHNLGEIAPMPTHEDALKTPPMQPMNFNEPPPPPRKCSPWRYTGTGLDRVKMALFSLDD